MTPDPVPGGFWAALPLPALMIDAAGLILAANPAAETFLNTSARTLLGDPVLDRVSIDAPMEDAFARARANQSPLSINDVDVTGGNRAPVQCSVHLTPVQCSVHLTPVQDGPDLLLILSPREMGDRLARASAGKSSVKSAIGMADMLAHEIKNPLAGISGAAQLLSMSLPPEDQELTDLIVEETRRVVKLLEQVEQFGNTRAPDLRAVNIHDALDRARISARMGFATHMQIVQDYDPSLPLTHADPDQLMQVFLNLIRNATEAAKGQPGTIRLRTYFDHSLRMRRPDGTAAALPLTIEIIDDGPGIPPTIAANIFEPFVSGRDNGTGLGLALVAKIVSDHGGWISVDSSPGRTKFRISLPVAPKDQQKGL